MKNSVNLNNIGKNIYLNNAMNLGRRNQAITMKMFKTYKLIKHKRKKYK